MTPREYWEVQERVDCATEGREQSRITRSRGKEKRAEALVVGAKIVSGNSGGQVAFQFRWWG